MQLISRYIIGHILKHWIAISVVLTCIVAGRQLIKLTTQSSAGHLPPQLVASLLAFDMPELLSVLLPLGLFLSVLLAFGKLYVDQEIPVLLATGFSLWDLYALPLLCASLVSCIVFLLQYISPDLHYQKEKRLNQLGISDRLELLSPGKFQQVGESSLVMYLESVDSQKQFSTVFIAEQPSGSEKAQTVYLAKKGSVQREQEGPYYLILEEGKRYEGVPGRADYQITRFQRFGQILDPQWPPVQLARRMMGFKALVQAGSPADWAEFQNRIGRALSPIVLVTIAVPLSRIRRGQGRYAKVLWGILLFIVYVNMLTLAKRFLVSGALPVSIGVWPVHGVFLIGALVALFKEGGLPFRKVLRDRL